MAEFKLGNGEGYGVEEKEDLRDNEEFTVLESDQRAETQHVPNQPKRVLIVAFDFPPRRTSGVYRPTALTKYLARFGWQPTVLTIGRSDVNWWTAPGQISPVDPEDQTLLNRVPSNIRVVRTRYWNVAGWEKKVAAGIQKAGALRSLSNETRRSRLHRVLHLLAYWLRSFLYFPDQWIGWLPFGVARAVQLHREKPFDLVYTTSPPRSAPLIGWWLKILLAVPWLVEFRDPWLPRFDKQSVRATGGRLRWKFEAWLHALILRHTDAVVTVAQGLAEELKILHRVPESKLWVVSNGFDEDDFHSVCTPAQNTLAPGYLHLSHFGTVYPQFSGSFFQALARLLRECPDWKQRLRVNIIGYPDEETLSYAGMEELQGVIQVHPLLRHAEALDLMRRSHFLLLFYAHPYTSRICVPGKLFEYLRVGRPILAVAFDGGAKDLVEEAKAGWVLPPDDPCAIQQVLKTVLSEQEGKTPASPEPPRPDVVGRFRYDRLAEKLAGVFNRIVDNER